MKLSQLQVSHVLSGQVRTWLESEPKQKELPSWEQSTLKSAETRPRHTLTCSERCLEDVLVLLTTHYRPPSAPSPPVQMTRLTRPPPSQCHSCRSPLLSHFQRQLSAHQLKTCHSCVQPTRTPDSTGRICPVKLTAWGT